MKFKDVAVKNFSFNISRYLAFFLCSCLCVAIFFIYTTLVFNNSFFAGLERERDVKMIIYGSMATIFIFSLFFINYAYSSFAKTRKSEYGLLLTLGMTNKNIRNLVLIENVILFTGSLTVGMLFGALLSRIFYMLLLHFMALENISFFISYKSFLSTIVVFVMVFIVLFSISSFSIMRYELVNLIHESRRGDKKGINSPIAGIIGLLSILLGFSALYAGMIGRKATDNISTFLLFCFIGIYLLISQLGNTIAVIIKLNRKLYYKYLLNITEYNYKIARNKKVLVILCILSAMVVFFIGAAYSVYAESLNNAEREQPFHVAYAEIYDKNRVSNQQLDVVINGGETTVRNKSELEFIVAREGNWECVLISSKLFNNVFNQNLSVPSGRFINLNLREKTASIHENGRDRIEFTSQGKEKKYELICDSAIYHIYFNRVKFLPQGLIVIGEEDYEDVKKNTDAQYMGKLHLINFEDWTKTGDIVKKIDDLLISNSKNYEPSDYYRFLSDSRLKEYRRFKQQGSAWLFMVAFIGLLFFITSGAILYFKAFTEISDVKDKYKKLFKLGITDKEIKNFVSTDLKYMFYAPSLIGSLIGYFYLFMISLNASFRTAILVDSLLVTIVYLSLQTIFYLFTRNKVYSQIIEEL